MSSTKPIISAKGVAAFAIAALVAAAAGGVGYVSIRQALTSMSAGQAAALLSQAQAMPRGAERDDLLQAAQDAAAGGMRFGDADPTLWNLLAEIRLLQATQSAEPTVSAALIDASSEASVKAAALSRDNAEAYARLALSRTYQWNGAREALRALSLSYKANPIAPDLSVRRVAAAARLWRILPADLHTRTEAESCRAMRRPEFRGAITALAAEAEPAFNDMINAKLSDPVCATQPG